VSAKCAQLVCCLITPRAAAGKIVVHGTPSPRAITCFLTKRDSINGVATADSAALLKVWGVIARQTRKANSSAANGAQFVGAQFANSVVQIGHGISLFVSGGRIIPTSRVTGIRGPLHSYSDLRHASKQATTKFKTGH
jgi:hypothetical protein